MRDKQEAALRRLRDHARGPSLAADLRQKVTHLHGEADRLRATTNQRIEELYSEIRTRDEALANLYEEIRLRDRLLAGDATKATHWPDFEEVRTSKSDGSGAFAFLAEGYQRREVLAEHYDDLDNEEEFQREVYDIALALAVGCEANSIVDFGCGSAFKLMRRFGDFENVIGLDRPLIVEGLRIRYPSHTWMAAPDDGLLPEADIVICSDVLEHLQDPGRWLKSLARATNRFAVLSTPERTLLADDHGHPPMGPPRNPFHHCEWTFDEFGRFVATEFDIVYHDIVNTAATTQLIVGRRRAKASADFD